MYEPHVDLHLFLVFLNKYSLKSCIYDPGIIVSYLYFTRRNDSNKYFDCRKTEGFETLNFKSLVYFQQYKIMLRLKYATVFKQFDNEAQVGL